MIRQLDLSDFPRAAEVIRASFATVAEEFEHLPFTAGYMEHTL